jgi:hypothetical protein
MSLVPLGCTKLRFFLKNLRNGDLSSVPDIPFPPNFGLTPPPPPDKRPIACLIKILDTYCLRTVGRDEYVFGNAEHAIAHYTSTKSPLRVCSACRELFLKHKKDQESRGGTS